MDRRSFCIVVEYKTEVLPFLSLSFAIPSVTARMTVGSLAGSRSFVP